MKRTIEEQMKIEYQKYRAECKKPKSYYDWIIAYKARTIKSLEKSLEEWKEFEPKRIVVVKIKRRGTK